ncbi:MAG: polysaccharide export protein [Neisseriaceae bacterium]|nr:polysaccharide export protein [Neisseriaceae bacterium]
MRLFHFAPCFMALMLLNACVPTSGPSARVLLNMEKPQENNYSTQNNQAKAEVIDVDDRIASILSTNTANENLSDLNGVQSADMDKVYEGDVLAVTLWEAPPAVLFGGAINSVGSGTAQMVKLPEQMISSKGTISIPFVGNIVVRGKTPAQIQNMIVSRLHRKANQPQALVNVTQKVSDSVTVIRAGKSLRMPLTGHQERVLDAVAAIGGVERGVQDISVQITRGKQVKTIALERITADTNQNILLRSGDVISMMATPLTFTAMGAVGANKRIEFAARGMTLSEAMGAMGGLQDRRANASGLFLLRYQPLKSLPKERQQTWLKQGVLPQSNIPVVYRVDLKKPQSLFWTQRIQMQDKDVVYVANAPVAEFQKFLQFIFSPISNGVSDIHNM